MNPHYIGMLVQCRDTKPSVIDKRKKVPEKECVIKENTHEAIVSPEIYWAAQDLIISRSRTRPQQEKHLFTNTIFCEDCGRGMHYKKIVKGMFVAIIINTEKKLVHLNLLKRIN